MRLMPFRLGIKKCWSTARCAARGRTPSGLP